VGPTILELADCEVPENYTAESLIPALQEDPDWSGRDYVFAEGCRDGNFISADYQTMIRSHEWKLVHITGSDPIDGATEGQLFDLTNDPNEQINLWDSSDHSAVKNELLLDLFEWRVHTSYHAADHYADAR